MSILDEIFEHKRGEVTEQKRAAPYSQVMDRARQAAAPLDFVAALRPPASGERRAPALIAEVKRASPSRGELAPDLDPLRLARIYEENGAAAISVLTERRYFKGRLETLRQIASLTPRLPLLRKDFICDPYQVVEARAAGAEALLLIASALEPALLRELHELTQNMGMAALVEVHSEDELEAALSCNPALIGINNRDLSDFSVDLETTARLKPHIPDRVCVVSESGIHTPEDVARLAEMGVDAVLVGEALVTAADIPAQVRRLAGMELAV